MTSKYHEHHALERQVAFLTLVTAGFGAILAVVGAMSLPRGNGWLALLGGVAMLGLAIGLWFAQEWARILVGVLALGALAWVLVGQGWQQVVLGWHLKGAVLAYGSYLLVPSTRHVFARAREARRREREAIREVGPTRRGSRGRRPDRPAPTPPGRP